MNNSMRTIINLVRDYKWKSLFFKYWKISFVFVMIPFTITYAIIFTYYNTNNKAKTLQLLTQNFYQSMSSFDNIFGNFNNYHKRISVNPNVIEYLRNEQIEKISPDVITNVLAILNEYSFLSQNIDSIFLYSFQNNYVLSTRNSNYLPNFYDTTWFNKYKDTGLDFFSVYSRSSYKNLVPDVLSNCYGIYNGSKLTGLIVFNTNISDLIGSFKYDVQSNLVLLDQTRNVIYTSSDKYSYIFNNFFTAQNYDGNEVLNFEKDNKYCILARLKNSNLLFSLIRPTQNSALPIGMFILVLLSATIIPLSISLYMSAVFYSSIAKIVTNLQFDSEDNLSEPEGYNELFSINKNILKMITKAENIETELSHKVMDLKKAQTIAMQTQLNPHFLFNTLNTISILAMGLSKTDKRLENIIALLSDLLYEALDTKNILITIEDELSYIKKYIQIMEIKECNSFNVVWDIDNALLDCKIIKLLLQPIVENAFEHGLKHKETDEEKIIKFSIKEVSNEIEINIFDNGPQIDHTKLQALQNELYNLKLSESKNIGLSNVNTRIKLIFGEIYGCYINSDRTGTTVTVRIPKQPIVASK